jgi:predicted RNA polymerase sigma factor
MPDLTDVERLFRAEYGRAVAVLVRLLGDIDLAEEAVQEAFTTAVGRWPVDGVQPSPAGWIITTARNRAVDRLRREAAINAVHSDAATAADTDWGQIVALYDQLMTVAPGPVVALNRAVAVAEVAGPAAALALVDDLDLAGFCDAGQCSGL